LNAFDHTTPMATPMTDSVKGLAGITAADSALSFIDGENGQLLYRGYDIHALAGQGSFAEALYLLWYGDLPTNTALTVFEGLLAQERQLPSQLEAVIRASPLNARPMSAVCTALSVLGGIDEDAEYVDSQADMRKAGRIVSTLPVAVAARQRIRVGLEPIEPDPNLSLAADFLRMLTGEMPDEVSVKAFDTSMLLYLEHGLNASTFACRVVASTLADLHACVTAGAAALSGPLHGGANEQAMRMLDEIGSVERVDEYVDSALSTKRKIMGFGHRVYQGEDPRATHLRRMAKELGEATGDSSTYELSRAVETAMLDRKGLHCNVDFYCAAVYRSLGIPDALFTPLFAIGRAGGWAAHVMEQHSDNRLIRPRARYTGESLRHYTQIDHRSD
jgi:citrate synthase